MESPLKHNTKSLQFYKEKIAAATIYKRWENIYDELRGTEDYDKFMEMVAEEILVDTHPLTQQVEELTRENEKKDKTLEWLLSRLNDYMNNKTYPSNLSYDIMIARIESALNSPVKQGE